MMKMASIAGCALFALAANGCMAQSDPSQSSEHTGTTTQAIGDGYGGSTQVTVPAVPGTPLYSTYFAASKELDVQTCDVLHPGMLDPDNPADHPCTALYPDRHLDVVNVIAVSSKGRILGDDVADPDIAADRPGGGCIHMLVPQAQDGGKIYVLAMGTNMDGSGRKSPQIFTFSLGT